MLRALWVLAVCCLAPGGALATDLQRLAPGVYVSLAKGYDAAEDNAGVVVNAGVLVGSEGVVVIDPGPSAAAGKALLREIRRVTRKPVVAVIATHPHPENVLAAASLMGPSTVLIGHARTYALMRDRCEDCFARLSAMIGERHLVGTDIVLPDQTVLGPEVDRRLGGRDLRLLHLGWGHTAGDLAVLDVTSGTLFAGGLVSNRVVPDMREADTLGWISALIGLSQVPAKRVVPAQGAVGPPSVIGEFRGYLESLLLLVRRPYDEHLSVFDVLADGELPDYRDWVRYADAHLLNIQHVYSELEREDFRSR